MSCSPKNLVSVAGLLASSLVMLTATTGCDKLRKAAGGIDAAVDLPEAAAPVVEAAPEAGPADTASAAASASAAPTASVHAAAADPGAVGTFGGQVTEGSLSYGMTVVLNDKGGTVSYALPFNCKGTWSLTSHDGKNFHYKEHITEQGGRKCAQGETANLVEVKPGVFTYSEGSAHATLNKR